MDTVKQLRTYRVGGVAMFDLILTFVAGYILDKFINFKNKRIFYPSLILVGITSHFIVGQKTFVNSQLTSKEFNLIKVIVLGIVFGILYELILS